MGRRKIEIQPITHERNRSVTFLKRKNGLFKKAYELGVLCSIDVAVIIFEEKPGHHVKLYEYCSSDINEIVNRRVRHEGEKDTLGPAHFSGNTSKTEDLGDGDDDDNDDDEDTLQRGTKRRIDTRDAYPPRSLVLHGIPPGSGNASSIPVSSDRHSAPRGGSSIHQHYGSNNPSSNKKPRMASISTHHRSSSDDHAAEPVSASSGGGSAGGAGYGYSSSPTASTTGFRHAQGGGGAQYNSAFPLSSSTPNLVASYDFRSGQPPSQNSFRGSGTGSGGNGITSYNSRGTGSTYESGMYSHMSRPMSQTPGNGNNPANASGTGDGGNDIFSFLHEDSHRSTTGSNSGTAYNTSIDWPAGTPIPSAAASNPSQSGSTNDNWLDFLSNNPSGGGNHSASGARRSSDTVSWERGGHHGHDRVGSGVRRLDSGEENEDYSSTGRSNGIGRKDLEIKKEKDVG